MSCASFCSRWGVGLEMGIFGPLRLYSEIGSNILTVGNEPDFHLITYSFIPVTKKCIALENLLKIKQKEYG